MDRNIRFNIEGVFYVIFAVVSIVLMVLLRNNAWIGLAAVATASAVLLGLKQYRQEGWHIIQAFENGAFAVMAVSFAVIFAVVLFCCESENLIHWYDMMGDSPDLSVASAMLAVTVAGLALLLVLYLVGRGAALIKVGLLYTRQQYMEQARTARRVRRRQAQIRADERRCQRAIRKK